MVALFVALMFIGFILLDAIVQKLEVRHAARVTSQDAVPTDTRVRGACKDWITVPEGVSLAEQHVWTLPLPEGAVRAGADSLVAKALGVVDRVYLPRVGDRVEIGEPLFRLEVYGRVISVPSPAAGRITAVNKDLLQQPGLLAVDPYRRGWVCCVAAAQPGDLLHTPLRFGTKAALWLEREMARFQEFVSFRLCPDFALGVTSQDGGMPVPGAMAQLGADAWAAFEREFLLLK